MTSEQFRHVSALAEDRDRKHYEFLKQLLLLSSGALTLLVTLGPPPAGGDIALWSMRAAWLGLGLGILALAVALHGEVWTAADLAKKVGAELAIRPVAPRPVVATRPKYYGWAERIGYAGLASSVLAMVLHGLCR